MSDRRAEQEVEMLIASDRLRSAAPILAQWLSRRQTLLELLRRSGPDRYQLVRIFAAGLNVNHLLPDQFLHIILRRWMLLCLLLQSPASAASKVNKIIQRDHAAGGGRVLAPVLPAAKKMPDISRQNVLLVVHQTSRTGAPILGWNIARHLADRYNIFTVALGGGPLLQDFAALSIETHGPFGYIGSSPATIDLALTKLFNSYRFKFAIINSAESRVLVQICAARAIPTVFLVHEFASYIAARDELRTAFDLATEIVFPAKVVAESSVKLYPSLQTRTLRILPQGMSVLPAAGRTSLRESHFVLQQLAAARAQGALVVLGAGTVEFRKGVDLFLATAMRICRDHQNFRFLWVGHGYKPDQDMAYSNYLREQVQRSGLDQHVIFLDQLPDLEPVYAVADFFMLASRLDPMPNVTIDAAHRGIPVICFNEASGMADVLKSDPITAGCVVDYLDAAMAADAILSLGRDRDALRSVAAATQRLATEVFDMTRYVDALDRLGSNAATSPASGQTPAPLPAYPANS
jgi:glycosyltransferase involved in cell wall biosynthesis